MHQHCHQFDRLWALGPCDLIDLSRTSTRARFHRHSPLHFARLTATGLGVINAHHSNPTQLGCHRRHISGQQPPFLPSFLSGYFRNTAASAVRHPFLILVSASYFLVSLLSSSGFVLRLTVSDGIDSPPYSRVIGSSAPPRLCRRLARCRRCAINILLIAHWYDQDELQ